MKERKMEYKNNKCVVKKRKVIKEFAKKERKKERKNNGLFTKTSLVPL